MSVGERVQCRLRRSVKRLDSYFIGTQGLDSSGRGVVIDDQWHVWPMGDLTEISIVDVPSAAEKRNETLARQYGVLQDSYVEQLAEKTARMRELETENRRLAKQNATYLRCVGEVGYVEHLEESVRLRVTERNNLRNELRRLQRELAQPIKVSVKTDPDAAKRRRDLLEQLRKAIHG